MSGFRDLYQDFFFHFIIRKAYTYDKNVMEFRQELLVFVQNYVSAIKHTFSHSFNFAL